MKTIFYVYEWFNKNTNEIFYVGKGSRNRVKSYSHRNKLFLNYIKENICDYRIIKYFDDEEDAFAFEHKRIMELKAINQSQCNLDYGGKGGCNFVWTSEMKDYQSKYNPMKQPEQKERMSKHNPMKNREVASIVGKKHSKAVIINNVEYSSVKQASEIIGVSQQTIINWCRKGVNNHLQPCKYKDKEQVVYKKTRYNIAGCREVEYKNRIYESPIDLARELGLHHSTICKWAKKGFDTIGNICVYTDDKNEHIFKPFIKGESNKKLIKVNGIIYNSKADAEMQLGLSKGYLAPYIAGTRKNKKYICEYVNQQPSTNLNG